MDTEKPLSGASPPPLVVRVQGHDRSLPGNRSYLIGRDPQCDIVITDDRVSWQHAVLAPQGGRWVLADNGSTNGTYADGRRVARIEIDTECVARLGHPGDGPVLTCTVTKIGRADPGRPGGHAGTGAVTGDATAVLPAPRPGPEPPPPPGRTLRIGRAPDNDIVVPDPGVSRHHAELRHVAGGYRIADLASHNGTFVNGQRATDTPLAEGDVVGIGPARFRLAGQELQRLTGTGAVTKAPPPAATAAPPVNTKVPAPPRSPAVQASPASAPPASAPGPAVHAPPVSAMPPGDALATVGDGPPIEIPYAVRWLVPNGERFANFAILNDNDTQLDYYRRFGHIYAVGIPAKKWRLVVVSDPELLDRAGHHRPSR